MAKVTARMEVVINGVSAGVRDGVVLNGIGISGEIPVERKPIFSTTGIVGFGEDLVEASIELTVIDKDDQMLSDFGAINGDGTIIAKVVGGEGKVYTLNNATCVCNMTLTSGEGETEVKFIGTSWTEATQ